MKITQSAIVVLTGWLAALAPAGAQNADDPAKDPLVRRVRAAFPLAGVTLLDSPSRPIRGAACRETGQNGLSWCATAPTYESAPGGTFRQGFGYNTDANGSVVYVVQSRREFPLARSGIDEDMQKVGARYGRPQLVLTFRGSTEEGAELFAQIAVWGGIRLVRLNDAELRIVAKGGTLGTGHVVDFRQDPQASAERRDPVFKIEGSAGFIAQYRSVTDVRTDIVLRAVYQPAFIEKAAPKPEPKPVARGPLPLDPGLALALNRQRAEAEARKTDAERRAAE
ncbi:MAG: hypothetical protein KIT16_12935, partial [Rhodospirillaceae bacterium]|nr:hypothetical protein [Rhodospirillaceae bacterium]